MNDEEISVLLELEDAARKAMTARGHDRWPSGAHHDCQCRVCLVLKKLDKIRKVRATHAARPTSFERIANDKDN